MKKQLCFPTICGHEVLLSCTVASEGTVVVDTVCDNESWYVWLHGRTSSSNFHLPALSGRLHDLGWVSPFELFCPIRIEEKIRVKRSATVFITVVAIKRLKWLTTQACSSIAIMFPYFPNRALVPITVPDLSLAQTHIRYIVIRSSSFLNFENVEIFAADRLKINWT